MFWQSLVWRVFANIAAVLALTLGGTYGLLWATSHPGEPVWVADERDFKLLTPSVPTDGELRYIATLDARESCPGSVQHVFRSPDAEGGITLSISRPIVAPGVDVTRRLFSVLLPHGLIPGKYHVLVTAYSRCTTRTQSDKMAEFDLEVTQ